MISMEVDGKRIECSGDKTILAAALEAGIHIPHLCSHPQLDSFAGVNSLEIIYQGDVAHRGDPGTAFEGCNLCLVEIEGREGQLQSCKVIAEQGMVVHADSPELKRARQDILANILKRHPHACLLCPQSEGCDRKVCSVHIPEDERCCSLFGNCELEKVAHFVGMDAGIAPYVPLDVKPLEDEPLILRDYGLCISCLRCVRICKEVKGADALGFVVEEGRIVVGSREPTLKESGCQFCGFCVEVCPTGALMDRGAGVGEREKNLVPCKTNCPAGIDIPGYIRLIAEGKFGEAVAVIREKVPFPGVLGHVCYHPCETVCRRGELNDPVSICILKCSAVRNDTHLWERKSKSATSSGKKVAVIGSGPAGLTAAYYLVKLGHSVTVFEAMAEAGGMMRAGISVKTLPREVLDEEIKAISDAGVQIETNTRVASLDDLFEEGYDALFIAAGAPQKEFNQVFVREPDMLMKWGLQKGEQVSIEVDPNTLATAKQGVFAGGDVVRGPAMVRRRRAK